MRTNEEKGKDSYGDDEKIMVGKLSENFVYSIEGHARENKVSAVHNFCVAVRGCGSATPPPPNCCGELVVGVEAFYDRGNVFFTEQNMADGAPHRRVGYYDSTYDIC